MLVKGAGPAARSFIDTLKSEKARQILRRYGFEASASSKKSMNWQAIWTTLKLASATSIMLLAADFAEWVMDCVFQNGAGNFSHRDRACCTSNHPAPDSIRFLYGKSRYGPRSPFGRAYASIAGHGLPFTFAGLVVASVFYSLPFAIQPMIAAFGSVDRKLIEASWMLGVSNLQTFFRIIVPLSWAGVLTGFMLSFALRWASLASS